MKLRKRVAELEGKRESDMKLKVALKEVSDEKFALSEKCESAVKEVKKLKEVLACMKNKKQKQSAELKNAKRREMRLRSV